VFRRFYRGEGARRDAVPGLGLGLHVARALVVAHGGSLTVADREGGGAAFTVDLPDPVA
jgi:signal transduction histidine kinase